MLKSVLLTEPVRFNERMKVMNTFLAHKCWTDTGIYCAVSKTSCKHRPKSRKHRTNVLNVFDTTYTAFTAAVLNIDEAIGLQ